MSIQPNGKLERIRASPLGWVGGRHIVRKRSRTNGKLLSQLFIDPGVIGTRRPTFKKMLSHFVPWNERTTLSSQIRRLCLKLGEARFLKVANMLLATIQSPLCAWPPPWP